MLNRLAGLSSAALALSLFGASVASAITVNIAPGAYNDLYTSTAIGGYLSGNQSFSATNGTTYTVGPWGGLAGLGTFTVNDLGGGISSITTNTPGLIGDPGAASPTVSFSNLPFTINRGPNYTGAVGWDFKDFGAYANRTDDTPLGTTNLRAYYGNVSLNTNVSFKFSTDASGNVTITQQPTSGAIISTSGSTIILPASPGIVTDVPPGITSWTIDYYQAGVSIADPTVQLLPGTWSFNANTASGATTTGVFTIPGNPAGWVQTVVVTQGANSYSFLFAVPEPSSMMVVGIGAIVAISRRGRRARA